MFNLGFLATLWNEQREDELSGDSRSKHTELQALQILSLCAKTTVHYSSGKQPTKGLQSSKLPAKSLCV